MEYQSQELDKLFSALAKAQGQFSPVAPDEKVDFTTKSGLRVKYDYASFKALFSMAQKPLSDNGLAVASFIQGDKLITRLSHESGQWTISEALISQGGDIKAFGADISYLRRYQYAAIIGAVVGGEDNEHVAGETEQNTLKAVRAPSTTLHDNTKPHWATVTEDQQKAIDYLNKKGIPLYALFDRYGVKSFEELAQKPLTDSGRDVLNNTIDYWGKVAEAQRFYLMVQDTTKGYYKHQSHLWNTVGEFRPTDKEAQFAAAIDHAVQRRAEKEILTKEVQF